MASYTTNLNLKKPAGSENVAIGDINNNMDTIDQAFGTLNSNITPKSKTLTVTLDGDKAASIDQATTQINTKKMWLGYTYDCYTDELRMYVTGDGSFMLFGNTANKQVTVVIYYCLE